MFSSQADACVGRRRRFVSNLVFSLVVATLATLAATATPAAAAGNDVTDVDVRSADSRARVVLTFDDPIDRQQADAVREVLSRTVVDNQPAIETLGCNSYTDRPDANGMLTLQLTCLPSHGALAWGFRLSPQIQAMAVGPVDEDGLRWWKNSQEQSKNAPLTVPSDYLLHGTMRRVFVTDILDYQDVITFRHNIGSGGTARVVFAGSLELTY